MTQEMIFFLIAQALTAAGLFGGLILQGRSLKSTLELNHASAINETEESELHRAQAENTRLQTLSKQNEYISNLQTQYITVQNQLGEVVSKLTSNQIELDTVKKQLKVEQDLRRHSEEERMIERQKRLAAEKEAEEANRLRVQEVNDWRETVHELEAKVREQADEIKELKSLVSEYMSKEKPSDV